MDGARRNGGRALTAGCASAVLGALHWIGACNSDRTLRSTEPSAAPSSVVPSSCLRIHRPKRTIFRKQGAGRQSLGCECDFHPLSDNLSGLHPANVSSSTPCPWARTLVSYCLFFSRSRELYARQAAGLCHTKQDDPADVELSYRRSRDAGEHAA